MPATIVVTRRIPVPGLSLLEQAGARVQVLQNDPASGLDREPLLRGAAAADVLLALLTERVDREIMEHNPGLRGVANMAVGYNNIDIAAATELGVPVSNTPGILTEATADLTWALLLAAARRIPEAHAYMTAGRFHIWGPELLLGADVGPGADGGRRTLGIIGFGRIGQAVARRARGFDMRVLAYTPRSRHVIDASDDAEYAPLDVLLAVSDFVTLHAPYSGETHHMIDERALRSMKPTSYLINVARGELVDENALVRALDEGRIAGAALDVYENEPAMAPGLAAQANVVLVPHIGSATYGTRSRMATVAATNAVAHLRLERAPNVVNPDVYDTAAYCERVERVRAAATDAQ
jgi:glyoxylate reductase